MKRTKNFYISSIKMDLTRIMVAGATISQNLPEATLKTFFNHIEKDFAKIPPSSLNEKQQGIKKEITNLKKQMKNISKDPSERLRWAERVLTAANRL